MSRNSSTVQETVIPKSRSRIPTRTKSKPVIVSARKTRSAAKVIAEREAAATAVAKVPIEKSIENKRKIRKRKQSKSIDRPVETSDDENPSSNSTHTITNRRKTRKRKKSRTDHHSPETSNDENLASNRTRKRNDRQQEMMNENEISKRKTKKLKEREISDHENDKTMQSMKRKKSKISTNDNEEKQTKVKKRKPKTKKTKSNYIKMNSQKFSIDFFRR